MDSPSTVDVYKSDTISLSLRFKITSNCEAGKYGESCEQECVPPQQQTTTGCKYTCNYLGEVVCVYEQPQGEVGPEGMFIYIDWYDITDSKEFVYTFEYSFSWILLIYGTFAYIVHVQGWGGLWSCSLSLCVTFCCIMSVVSLWNACLIGTFYSIFVSQVSSQYW